MGLFDNLVRRFFGPPPVVVKQRSGDHAVIVYFEYGTTDLSALFALEDQLIGAVDAAAIGEVDGHDIAMDASDGHHYLYGRDADALFAVVEPLLRQAQAVRVTKAVLRYGEADDPAAKEITHDFNS